MIMYDIIYTSYFSHIVIPRSHPQTLRQDMEMANVKPSMLGQRPGPLRAITNQQAAVPDTSQVLSFSKSWIRLNMTHICYSFKL